MVTVKSPDGQAHHQKQEKSCNQHAPADKRGSIIGEITGIFRSGPQGDETRQRRRAVRHAVLAAMICNRARCPRIWPRRIPMALLLEIILVLIVTAPNFTRTGFIVPCRKEGRFPGITVSVATNFVAALFIASALACREIVAVIVFVFALAVWMMAGWKDVVPGIGGRDWASLASWSAEVRQNLLGLSLTLAQSGEVVRDGFFLVEADLAGISADETFIEDSARKLVKVFVLQGAEHARADFCAVGDGIELEAAPLALLAKFFSESSQDRLQRACLTLRPYPDGNNHRRSRTHMLGGDRDRGPIRGTMTLRFLSNVSERSDPAIGIFSPRRW